MTDLQQLVTRFVTAHRQEFLINCGGYVEQSMSNGFAPTVPLLKEFEQLVEAKEKEIQELSYQRSTKITCVRITLQKILDADSSTKEWLLIAGNRLNDFIDLLVPPPIKSIKLYDIDGNAKDCSGTEMFQILQEQVKLDGVEHLTLTKNSEIRDLILKYD
jgi:hypothetical protein